MAPGASSHGRRRILLERKYRTTIERLWELWTTKEGIESWWGPEGFEVAVTELDLRPGGRLRYTMTALAPEQIKFAQQAGLPISSEAKLTFTIIEDGSRIAFKALVDFIPGIDPYVVETTVDFIFEGKEVVMLVSFDPMHDEVWTERARLGRESELGKLDRILAWPQTRL